MSKKIVAHASHNTRSVSEKLHLITSKKYGRTVIANSFIKKGTVFLVEPVLVLPKKECDGVLSSYVYMWSGKNAIVLGLGSLFNHSFTPNAAHSPDYELSIMKFYALKNIEYREEIFINYNGDPDDKTPVWFEVK